MTTQTMDTINDSINDAIQEQEVSQQDSIIKDNDQEQQTSEQPPVEQPERSEQPTSEQTEDSPEGNEEPRQHKKKGVQKRIDELTRKAHDAAREAKYWREQYAAKQEEVSSKDVTTKPARTEFANDDAYLEALTEWKVDQKVQRYNQQTHAERANEAQTRHDTTRFELYQQRVAESELPDYQKVVGESDVPAAPHVLESILDSENGPTLAYHLAKNPDVAQQLNEMTPLQAAREIGLLEAQLAQPRIEKRTTNKVTTSKAPEPITPVRGGNGQFQKAPEAMTDTEWFKSRKTS